jgi:hypothetical protein
VAMKKLKRSAQGKSIDPNRYVHPPSPAPPYRVGDHARN